MTLLHNLQFALGSTESANIADGELIARFVSEYDASAFEELVRRHGSLVFGVCRRILRHQQEAEDAFQAVFLVFAQKAGSIRPPEKLAAWLHGVASRTALKARTKLQKRTRFESANSEPIPALEQAEPERNDWLDWLDEEIRLLPESLREPVLLCGLQGKTRKEAADELGCPEGTVAGRFYRAKQLLARRLAKRGVHLSIGAITCWFESAGVAAPPLALLASTVRLGEMIHVEALGEFVPDAVQTLYEGVSSTMSMSKWKILAVCLCLLTASLGVSYLGIAFAGGEPDSPKSDKEQSGRRNLVEIEPELVFEEPIQKELRLSKNQISKLKAAWSAGGAEAKEEKGKVAELDKELAALKKKIEALSQERNKLTKTIGKHQRSALRLAIEDHLSRQAVTRLRQITLRRRSLQALLSDRRLQEQLKIDDEQLKKLQELPANTWFDLTFTKQPTNSFKPLVAADWDRAMTDVEVFGFMDHSLSLFSTFDEEAVLKILTPQQRKMWKQMLGEPFPRPKKK